MSDEKINEPVNDAPAIEVENMDANTREVTDPDA